jgi:hypothetical protein
MLEPGDSITNATLNVVLRSSLGGQHEIKLPENSELLNVAMDDTHLPIQLNNSVLALPITPGTHTVDIKWRESRGISAGLFKSSEINLGAPYVNSSITITPGVQRWLLFVGGVQLGPAILFWGILVVVVAAAILFSRIKDVPLTLSHWLMLGIGLSTTTPLSVIIVAGWFIAMRWRDKHEELDYKKFNATQVILVVLTFMMLSILLAAVQNGLLGYPNMQVSGWNSNSYTLNWYLDRSVNEMPQAWIVSVPVMVYRVLMLLWAIWMAFSLIKWLRWGWSCYSKQGYWMPKPSKIITESSTEHKYD